MKGRGSRQRPLSQPTDCLIVMPETHPVGAFVRISLWTGSTTPDTHCIARASLVRMRLIVCPVPTAT